MVTPELKWPTTNFTPSAANLLATETPCLGSATSSPNDTRIFLPRIPPASLMSAIACSAPFFSCAPKAASGPVIGPPTPNLTVSPCSLLQAASASPIPNARPSVISLFIELSITSASAGTQPRHSYIRDSSCYYSRCHPILSPGISRAPAPAQETVTFVDPPIIRDHLAHPHS